MFSEEALGELPVLGKLAGLFHHRVYPGDASRYCLVFDAVTGVGVVFHYFAGSALSFDVYLEEDYVAGTGHSYAVLFDEAGYCAGVEDCLEEGDEVAVKMMAYAPEDYAFREGA